jgi:hypothetical protein
MPFLRSKSHGMPKPEPARSGQVQAIAKQSSGS